MTSLLPNIVEVLMNKIALWISNHGNDWTAESAMIASNGEKINSPILESFYWQIIKYKEFAKLSNQMEKYVNVLVHNRLTNVPVALAHLTEIEQL